MDYHEVLVLVGFLAWFVAGYVLGRGPKDNDLVSRIYFDWDELSWVVPRDHKVGPIGDRILETLDDELVNGEIYTTRCRRTFEGFAIFIGVKYPEPEEVET